MVDSTLAMRVSRRMMARTRALSSAGLAGCVAFSQEHPVSESRYVTPEMQAYWLDRRWREDKADYWSADLERQRSARMAREMGN